jgi:TonB family protein
MDISSLAAIRPEPQTKVSPELPAALADICGAVTIQLGIGANGVPFNATVAKSTHEELNALCLAAAKRWRFKPATVQGRAIASNVYLPFHFQGSPMSVLTTFAKAEIVDNETLVAIRQSNPDIPAALSGINADVSLALTVDSHGYVVNSAIESATNDELAELARVTALRWKFKPIVKDGRAITVKAIQPVKFGKGAVSVAKVDTLPSVRYSVKPILPEELKGVSGFARAVFDVNAAGDVVEVAIVDGSHDMFNDAILEVAKAWTFNPALRNGVATEARVTVPFVFGVSMAAN